MTKADVRLEGYDGKMHDILYCTEDGRFQVGKMRDAATKEMCWKLFERENFSGKYDSLDAVKARIAEIYESYEGRKLLAEYFEIENSVSEWSTTINGMFTTLKGARIAIKDCSDWWSPKGTGKIYRRRIFAYPDGRVEIERDAVWDSNCGDVCKASFSF